MSVAAKTDRENAARWLPLHYHLMDTAGILSRLMNNWLSPAAQEAMAQGPDGDALRRVAAFLALVHDIGKATPAFQQKIIPLIEGGRERLERSGLPIPKLANAAESPHTVAGEALLRQSGVPEGLASIVGAHHGRPVNRRHDFDIYQMEVLRDNYHGRGAGDGWRRVQAAYLDWAIAESGFASIGELPSLPVPVQMLLTGLLIMADWIASNTRFFPLIDADAPIPPYDARRVDAAWSRLSLMPCWIPEDGIPPDMLCMERFGFASNALQAQVVDIISRAEQPGLLVIEAQMGSG